MDDADIEDLFAAFGPVRLRRMFGGRGIFADGVMFALETGGLVYLKADDALARDMAERGATPFSYSTKDGTRTIASYWQVPETAMDDTDDLAALARRSLLFALAASAAKPKKPGGQGASRRASPRKR